MELVLPPTRPGGAAADETVQQALTSTCGVAVAAVEAIGAVGAEGNARKAGLTLQVGSDALPSVRLEGASRLDMDAERPTAQLATEAAAMVEEMRPASQCSPIAQARTEEGSSRTSRAAAAPLPTMPAEGGEMAVSKAPEGRGVVAPAAVGGMSGDDLPRGERDPRGEKETVRAAVAPLAVEGSLPTFSFATANDEPAQTDPQAQSSRSSPPVFKLGTLPSRAKFGHPPSPAFSTATSTPSMVAADRRPAKPCNARRSKAPTAQSPPGPPAGEGQIGPLSSSNGTGSRPGKSGSPTGGQQQQQESGLEPVVAVSRVSMESCYPAAASQAKGQEAEAQV